MTTHYLRIETHGICTHFTRGVVSGVPHRVVLPNATHIQAQRIAVADGSPVLYYLTPHFAQLDVPGGPELTIEGVLRYGDFLTGARLQVINCIDQRIEYGLDQAPNLSEFDPHYTISDDVVLQGRAACYFDVYGGVVTYNPPPKTRPDGAGFFSIDLCTDGPPELLVTPLSQWSGNSQDSYRQRLGESTDRSAPVMLKVLNVELAREIPAEQELGSFDFLLHYLTARGGIPDWIKARTPGMHKDLKSVEAARMAQALRELATAVAGASAGETRRELMHTELLTSSCAASQYP